MKYVQAIGAAAALAGQVVAFPAAVREAVAANPEHYEALAKEKRLNGINPGFNATAQYISTSGQYAWVAPTSTDLRGPCPGLNAFANHGYLPHNGVATIAQFIEATTTVVGMGADLAGFLSIYGALFDGDLTSWSIGGPTSLVGVPLLGTPLNLVGTPEGLSGSHNKYEADVSPTRPDLYEYGNDYLLRIPQFKALYALQADVPKGKQDFSIGVQTTYRVARFQDSINKNPYFFNNFFSGLLVQPAAYTFQFRFMANHSHEYPEGRLDGEVLKTWFGVTGKYPNFKHTPGYERIPNQWYRRAFGDEYTIPYFLEDLVGMAVENPQFLDFGGNTNGVNTFTGLDLLNITGGLYNTKDFTNTTVVSCFIYQMLLQQAPDILFPLVTLTEAAENLLGQAASYFGNPNGFDCSTLQSIQQAQFRQALQVYPGYTKLNSNGAYPSTSSK